MDPRHSMQSRGPMQSGGSMCRPEDLARAFCCSEAVFLEKNKHVDEYLKRINSEIFPFVQFGEVLVSDEGWNTRGLKFLVAHADDATFIAFRGSPNFEDLCREHIHSPLTIRDKLHGGIFELSESFMVSGCKLLLTLFIEGKRTGKRIVFCGHRLGGAVAHMVVLRFWTENGIDEIEVENCRDSMISIAFGAPNMCNIKRALEVNNNDKLKSHFFNVVHEDDPFTSSLNGPGEDVNCCIGQSVPLSSSGNAWRLFSSKKKSPNQSNVSKPWTREKFCNSYKSGVAAAKMCVSVPVANSDVKPPKLVVSSPTPKVTSAKRKASDNSGSFISIKGYNLLFLSDPVKLDGLVPWETTMQTDTEIMISAPNSTEIMDGNALSKVVLCTAFGGTTHVVTEDGTLDGVSTAVPLKSLSRIVQTFFVLATPPLCILPASKVLQDLDSIVECVPDLKDKKLSTVLRATAEGGDNLSEEDIRKNMDEMNDVVKGVIEFLTRSYILQLEKNLLPTVLKFIAGGLLFAAGMVMMPVGGFALVGGGIPVIATAVTAAGIGATVRGANVVAVSLGKGRLVVREYTEMLEVAIHEASHWSANKGLLNLDRTSTAALESALHKEVQEFGEPRYLPKMIEKIKRSESNTINLHSDCLKGATLDSKKNLVRRMQIVTKSIDIFNKEVKGTQFLGLVGAEDAGKSTFIKKAIQRFGVRSEASELPEVGFKFHTKTVRPYKLRVDSKLYLVDFPGGNGTEKYAEAWKQFTSLPSSCILLIPFMGDIKKDQVKMYRKMKNDLDTSVAVVFNKVDEMFTPRKEAEFDAEYFSNHRAKTVEKLGCKSEDVHYASLDPDPEEKMNKLKQVGVLDFDELAKKLLPLS